VSSAGAFMMRSMKLRLLVAALLAMVAFGVAAAEAAAPSGPRLAVSVSRPHPNPDGIETVGLGGSDPVFVTEKASGDRPAWSPDGNLVAFTGSYGELSPVSYVVGSEGGKPRLVSKTTPLSDPIFTPDGRWLAFLTLRVVKGHFHRPQVRARHGEYGVVVDWAIWKVSLDGKRTRRVTGWKRRQQLTPVSFSPDGRYLAAERFSGRSGDAVLIDLKSRDVRVIARDAEEPVFSPDGTKIAYVRTRHRPPPEPEGNRPPGSSALLVVPANLEEKPRRLARIKGGLAWPSWDPSGSRIAFTTLKGGESFVPSTPAQGNSVLQVNADGTCLGPLLSIEDGRYMGVAWQPGPGRGAGPIAC
jgi:Tol biopolymer transport system component